MSSITNLFTPLIGQLMWGIHRGHGSALMMEFGKPHLRVRNPIQPRHSVDTRVRENLSRRRIFPSGQWGFLIMDSEWEVSAFSKTCHCNNAKAKVDAALECLDGQQLVSVDMEPDNRWFVMTFDLGGKLRVSLFPQVEGACWSLSNSDEGIIAAYENGELRNEPATQCTAGGIVVLNNP